ncbi:Uncharacterised protein [Vibrio cholerae]|nr:Uncharacterised protein [Vibrio cholerae]CSI17777.1 Uncharacterised protein [Vibrio cholerae]
MLRILAIVRKSRLIGAGIAVVPPFCTQLILSS